MRANRRIGRWDRMLSVRGSENTLDYASDSSQIPSPIHDAQRQEDDNLTRLPPQPNGSAQVESTDDWHCDAEELLEFLVKDCAIV